MSEKSSLTNKNIKFDNRRNELFLINPIKGDHRLNGIGKMH